MRLPWVLDACWHPVGGCADEVGGEDFALACADDVESGLPLRGMALVGS